MAELAVDLTYGTALLEAAREMEKEDLILQEGLALVELLKAEADFRKFIAYPGISATEKKEVITSVFEGRICNELLNLLYILVDKRRTDRFPGIIKAYRTLLEKEEGVEYGTVLSVIDMDETQIAKIEEDVSKLLQTKVKLTNKTDPGILAGVKVLIDGKIIDASYRRKLDDLSARMRKL